MRRFVVSRLIQTLIMVPIFVTVTYWAIQAMPGDFTTLLFQNPRLPPEARQALAAQFGLDQPPHVQYLRYMANFVRGNLGVSIAQYPRPVWDLILERLPRTVVLFTTATVTAFYLGFVLGKVLAWRRGAAVDYAATVAGITFYTAFYPLVAFVLIWLFAYLLRWLPINQFIDPAVWQGAPVSSNTVFGWLVVTMAGVAAVALGAPAAARRWARVVSRRQAIHTGAPLAAAGAAVAAWAASPYGHLAWDIVRHMILPVAALTLVSFAGTMLLMRDSMLETVKEDYVLAARARGLPDGVVRDRYAARTAILPVATSLTFAIAGAISGGVVTESVFSWPGIGQLLYSAAITQDYPVALGAFTFTGLLLLLAHLAADVLYAVLDPRISYEPGEGERG